MATDLPLLLFTPGFPKTVGGGADAPEQGAYPCFCPPERKKEVRPTFNLQRIVKSCSCHSQYTLKWDDIRFSHSSKAPMNIGGGPCGRGASTMHALGKKFLQSQACTLACTSSSAQGMPRPRPRGIGLHYFLFGIGFETWVLANNLRYAQPSLARIAFVC